AEANYADEMDKLARSLHVHLGIERAEPPKVEAEKAPEVPAVEHQPEPALPPNLSPELAKAVEILQNEGNKWWRRADAARAIADSRDLSLLPILEAYANDRDLDVQRVAQRSIQEIKSPKREPKPPTPPRAAPPKAVPPTVKTEQLPTLAQA